MAIRTEYLTPPQNFRSALFDDNNSYAINEYLTGNKTVIDYSSGDSVAFVYDRSAFSTEPGYFIGLEYWDAANNVVAITSGFSYYIDSVRGAEAAFTKLLAQNVEVYLTQYDDWFWFDPAGDAIADSQTGTGRTLFIDGGRGQDTFYDPYWGSDNYRFQKIDDNRYNVTFEPVGETFELRNFEFIDMPETGKVTVEEFVARQNAPPISSPPAPSPPSSSTSAPSSSKNDASTQSDSKNSSSGQSGSKNEPSYNEIVGSKAGERLQGTDGNDLIKAMDGNDRIIASRGDDLIHGGLGIDTLVFSEPSSTASYSTTNVTEQGLEFTEKVATGDGSSSISGIERLTFSDQSFARDTSSSESGAGMVARVIVASFGVDQFGLYFGTGLSLNDAGQTKTQLIDLVASTNLVAFDGDISDSGFVKEIFNNLVGEQPNSFQLAIYTSLVQDQGRAAFLELAVGHELTTDLVNDQITSLGIPYQEDLL